MVFTKSMFTDEAYTLVNAWATLQDNENKRSNSAGPGDTIVLDQWQVIENNSLGVVDRIYLVHPPIIRQASIALEENFQRSQNDEDAFTEDNLEDETIDIDCDTILHAPSVPTTSRNFRTIGTEWRFSIVYSDTWRVPVLYFTVQKISDGSPCLRNEVLHALHTKEKHEDEAVDTWDFVSSEEHPITGIPSFFLHPCQTSERLQLLMNPFPSGKDDGTEHGKRPSYLLSWMSMIFPAVGLHVSPEVFTSLQDVFVNFKTNVCQSNT